MQFQILIVLIALILFARSGLREPFHMPHPYEFNYTDPVPAHSTYLVPGNRCGCGFDKNGGCSVKFGKVKNYYGIGCAFGECYGQPYYLKY